MKPLAGRPEPAQHLINRLVDGELPENERRRFLESLDEDPARWREVALGFIESQCCVDACREMTDLLSDEVPCCVPLFSDASTPLSAQQHDAAEEHHTQQKPGADEQQTATESVPKPAAETPAQMQRRQRGARFLPVIASVAVAFSLGFIAQSRWSDWAERASKSLPMPNGLGNMPVTQVGNQLPQLDGGAAMRQVNLPLVPRSDAAANWLSRSDRVVSPELERSLSRYGHRVSEKRRVYPVQLKDGRRILVPVKDIELKYMGNRGYH